MGLGWSHITKLNNQNLSDITFLDRLREKRKTLSISCTNGVLTLNMLPKNIAAFAGDYSDDKIANEDIYAKD